MDRIKNHSMVRALARIRNQLTRPRTFENYNKIFCLGWLKTGTTSFGDAMRRLGFKHCGWDEAVYGWYKNKQLDKVMEFAEAFESFDDLPWNQVDLLERIDRSFPNSKFILLERDSQSWFASYLRHTQDRGYTPPPQKDASIREFEARQAFIKAYFREQDPQRLLVMNVIAGQGYEVLCPFLGVPTVHEPFPHSNPTRR